MEIITGNSVDDLRSVIRSLPILAAVLPFAAVHVAYWLGIETGRLPACLPYLDGCTSISSTGRHPPGSYVFKGIHMPFPVLLIVIWVLAHGWLVSLGSSRRAAAMRTLSVSGAVGAVALIVYTTFLGTTGELYEFMRRFGIYFYFFGTWGAQLSVSLMLLDTANTRADRGLRRIGRWMLGVCALPFVLGIANFTLKAVLDDADRSENRLEWLAALAMQAWFLLLYAAWRRTGISVRVTAAGG